MESSEKHKHLFMVPDTHTISTQLLKKIFYDYFHQQFFISTFYADEK